jgi:tetratricopeptide (TPR) repeat protein
MDTSEEMSQTFKEAFSLADVNPKQAIELYNRELNVHPKNLSAWHNMGLCKLKLAIANKDAQLLEESKADLRKSIKLAVEDGKEFSIAEANLRWAEGTRFE